MKYLYIALIGLLCLSCISIKTDVVAESNEHKNTNTDLAVAGIRLVMEAQEIAWNKHDLEGFMQGYWQSDQLKFYGANGLTLGWKNTLANYKKNYPTKTESGMLNFVINDITKIEGDSYWVMGEYHLKRTIGNADGVFIIIFKKIGDKWKIVADMTC